MQTKQRILITGGSGLVGKRLTTLLIQNGYEVAWLVRNVKDAPVKAFEWNPYRGEVDENALRWANHLVHLAGAGIADKRWSKERKNEIVKSRVDTTLFLKERLNQLQIHPDTLVAASAIGYYGAKTTEHIYREDDAPSDDFLGNVCTKWEDAHRQLSAQFSRTVIFRVGVVLAKEGGALPKMAAPVYFMAGSALGTGGQYIAWIHIDDLCRLFLFALSNRNLQGVFNACGTAHTNNETFIKAIGKAVNRPVFIPNIPAFILKAALGEMAEIVLEGSKVSSEKIQQSGFEFQYNNLDEVLKSLL